MRNTSTPSLEKRTYTVLKVYAIVSGRYEKHLHSISTKKNIHSAQGFTLQ